MSYNFPEILSYSSWEAEDVPYLSVSTNTLPKTNIPPSRKLLKGEIHLPTPVLQVRAVSFRGWHFSLKETMPSTHIDFFMSTPALNLQYLSHKKIRPAFLALATANNSRTKSLTGQVSAFFPTARAWIAVMGV